MMRVKVSAFVFTQEGERVICVSFVHSCAAHASAAVSAAVAVPARNLAGAAMRHCRPVAIPAVIPLAIPLAIPMAIPAAIPAVIPAGTPAATLAATPAAIPARIPVAGTRAAVAAAVTVVTADAASAAI